VFISEDGLALMNVLPLCTTQRPVITAADGTTLKFGAILGIFPTQDLALMKFQHRPKVWLRLAPNEPDVGEQLALVTIDVEDTEEDR
jgi:hypothetical protein